MHRAYIAQANFKQSTLTIVDTSELHHLNNVMRLKVGDGFQVFNHQGQLADVVIESISREAVKVKIIAVKQPDLNIGKIILACAVPKQPKFEEIIEKATELGANEIIPLQTARTEVLLKADKQKEKLARFHKVAVAAAKQCGCGQVPVIHEAMNLKQALKLLGQDTVKIIPSLHGHSVHISKALSTVSKGASVAFLIGPEGDFTPNEIEEAIKAGCLPVTMGQTVLRVETAAISAVALARFMLRS